MRILGLDPGSEHSAICGLVDDTVRDHAKLPNVEMLERLDKLSCEYDVLVIEDTKAFTIAGTKARIFPEQVRTTAFWAGRFAERWRARWVLMDRREAKRHLCGTNSAGDPQVRDAIIDRFGPGKARAVGRKAEPGPLFGVKRDVWAALAVAIVWGDQR